MPCNNEQQKLVGLTPATQEVFEKVSNLECIKGLFLCGGTAQALQMDHQWEKSKTLFLQTCESRENPENWLAV